MTSGENPLSQAWLFIATNVAQGLAMHPTATHNQKWAAEHAALIADELLKQYVTRRVAWRKRRPMHDASPADFESDFEEIDS